MPENHAQPDLLLEKLTKLRREREAVILAHNYQPLEIQNIADSTGDSLELSQKAAATNARTIVFCGVHFMAETAAILSPQKMVLLPVKTAGCPMADMIRASDVRELRAKHPGASVICYVNSSAEVKAESDVCCTSANAEAVAARFSRDQPLIFVPDQYLGRYVAGKLHRDFIYWDGFCPVHAGISPGDLQERRKEHPKAVVLAHPECVPEVTALADKVLSTSGMIVYVAQSSAHAFVVATELGLVERLRQKNPQKLFFPAQPNAICSDMKKITLSAVVRCLETLNHRVEVPQDIRERAQASVRRMLELA